MRLMVLKKAFLAVAVATCSLSITAVPIGQNLGIINGVPTGAADETALVNTIIGIHNSLLPSPTAVGSQMVYGFRVSTTDSLLPTAEFGFKLQSDSTQPGDELAGVLGDGYQYALAKYTLGQNYGFSYVYYLGGTGLDFDATSSGYGLAHLTFFNPSSILKTSGVNVPDGGTTAGLLGASLLGFAAFRRKS
jgi:hypothetical protein